MDITVNYNSDEITIIDQVNPEAIVKTKDTHICRILLEEIFNRIIPEDNAINVKLTVINEDSSTTLGEW